MGIEALREPEKEVTITPLDKGTLIHSILWEFFTDLKKRERVLASIRTERPGEIAENSRQRIHRIRADGGNGLLHAVGGGEEGYSG